MRPDGREYSVFSYASGFTIVDGCIYYQSAWKEISKVSLNGGKTTVMEMDKEIGLFDIQGEWIYFDELNNPYFNNWRVRLDGTDMQEL
jgi:hypothetical protein